MSAEATRTDPLLSARDLVQEFVVREAGGARGGVVQALSSVSFDIMPGETLGIVGETGSGKSTLARAVLQAPRPKSGSVVFRGKELTKLHGSALVAARRDMQFVWQDPFGSLDPKWQIRSIVEEPLAAHHVGSQGLAPQARGGAPRPGRPRPRQVRQAAPARAVRRAGAARRHRARRRPRAVAAHLRRGGLLA